ncbi:hypothetical protein [Streptomyces vietnamensis]|uniref:Uncharacterized protein n=1 Tax=Streptomyces vietnamensis TaxID=362257 RepID=A0A0B5IDR1_9ACTN|nr:hypothetical protein [Streptomyces vietnamensis]AJF68632.1 hypothetical protein SVTN_34140 [Streptomyces vietnamensis]
MRAHRAERGRRAGGAIGHLLLVVVLALGVFLMHSVGHPEGSGGSMHGREGTADTATASAPHHGASAHAAAPGTPERAAAPHDAGDSDARHAPGSGTDMTTLCVAVLGAWLLAGLLRAALGRRPDWLALLLARLTPALGPHAPPPRPPDLAQLSVLRI